MVQSISLLVVFCEVVDWRALVAESTTSYVVCVFRSVLYSSTQGEIPLLSDATNRSVQQNGVYLG